MNINGVNNLFPLKNLNSYYDGYYINASGLVFSTKRFTKPQQLMGSTQGFGSGRKHVFSFSNPSLRQARVEDGATLLANARRHADWAKHTGVITEAAPTGKVSIFPALPGANARHHASTTKEGIASKGYIIGRVDGQAIVFGSKPVIHTSLASVKDEVARLAQKTPGTLIIYVKIEGSAVANAIAWA